MYGGSAAYLVRGRSYSGGERSYSYRSARSVYNQHSYILVVGSGGYGCYSCTGTQRTCEPHCPPDCRKRSDCNGNRYTVVQHEHDYYDAGLSFNVPTEGERHPTDTSLRGRRRPNSCLCSYSSSFPTTPPSPGSSQWPLTLRVHGVTQFAARGSLASSGSDVFVSFFTADGDVFEENLAWSMPTTWVLTIFALFFACTNSMDPMESRRRRERRAERDRYQPRRASDAVSAPVGVAHRCKDGDRLTV